MNKMNEIHLPIANESERALLGGLILFPDECLPIAKEYLTGEDFHRERHGRLFDALMDRHRSNMPVSADTFEDWLFNLDTPTREAYGGMVYVAGLPDIGCSPYFLEHTAKEIRMAALKRTVIQLGVELTAQHDDELSSRLETAREDLRVVQARLLDGTWSTTKQFAHDTLAAIEQRIGQEKDAGRSWGFRALDAILGGRKGGQLVLIAARPGMGKSALMKDILVSAMRNGESVAVLSLEMSREELGERILCSEAHLDAERVRDGTLNEEERQRLVDAADWLSQQRIQVLDDTDVDAAGFANLARRAKETDPELTTIAIDYLQLLKGSGRPNRQEEVSEISRAMKLIAKELNVTVLALSQLNRAVESREGRRPVLADLRDSGSLEQDADVILFILRPEVYEQDNRPGEADIFIRKQRGGRTGTATLAWLGPQVRFADIIQGYST